MDCSPRNTGPKAVATCLVVLRAGQLLLACLEVAVEIAQKAPALMTPPIALKTTRKGSHWM